MKCALENWRCEHEDNGYCLCDEKCNNQKKVTEYMLGAKPMWKEY